MIRFLAAITVLLVLMTPAAYAEPSCGPRATVIAHLSENFGESRQTIGMADGGNVIEVFASIETGSWTITVTMPNGMTCLVAAGRAFELLVEAPAPAGTPS